MQMDMEVVAHIVCDMYIWIFCDLTFVKSVSVMSSCVLFILMHLCHAV